MALWTRVIGEHGDGKDQPSTPIHLLPDAVEEAFLRNDQEALTRMDRVASLIEGFEDPFGLELLSTVRWVIRQDPDARENAEIAVSAAQEWSPRKKQHLKRDHLLRAWQRLKEQGWISSAA